MFGIYETSYNNNKNIQACLKITCKFSLICDSYRKLPKALMVLGTRVN